MLVEDDRITGAGASECRAQVLAVCQCAADAAIAAIEAAGFVIAARSQEAADDIKIKKAGSGLPGRPLA